MTDPTTPAARPLPADVPGLVERILSMPHRMDCGLLGGYDGGCTCGHDQAVADAEAQARQIADLTAPDPRDEVIRGLVEALKAIDVGQSAIPDHWEYRCMARNTASAALAAARKLGVALPTIVHWRKTGKSTRSVK